MATKIKRKVARRSRNTPGAMFDGAPEFKKIEEILRRLRRRRFI